MDLAHWESLSLFQRREEDEIPQGPSVGEERRGMEQCLGPLLACGLERFPEGWTAVRETRGRRVIRGPGPSHDHGMRRDTWIQEAG